MMNDDDYDDTDDDDDNDDDDDRKRERERETVCACACVCAMNPSSVSVLASGSRASSMSLLAGQPIHFGKTSSHAARTHVHFDDCEDEREIDNVCAWTRVCVCACECGW